MAVLSLERQLEKCKANATGLQAQNLPSQVGKPVSPTFKTWSRVPCALVLCLYGIALAVLLLFYLLCCVACCRNAGSRPAKRFGQFHQFRLLSLNVDVYKPLL